ncbi:MAG: FAD-dependent oxidoreductase [Bryobacteraceae bacterium]
MRLLVIGGVAAGMSAASRARRIDAGLEILVLEKGATVSYGACGLPFYIDGRVRSTEQLVTYSPEFFLRERNIKVRTGAAVTGISHARRQVTLEGGEQVHYDRLVIATGARPDRKLPGADLPHVFTLHTLSDAERLRSHLEITKPGRAVVVGGGYIGLETADALRRRGLDVTVLTASNFLLHREDEHLTKMLTRHLEKFGVALHLGTRVGAIEPQSIAGVPCDLAILATGLRPNVELAVEAGVELGRTGAIRTDERMATNLPGVYAAGDCAEALHRVTGRAAYVPLGTTANKMGRVAGANAAGARERFAGITGTSIVELFGLGIGLTGLSEAQAKAERFDPVSVRVDGFSHARYLQGRPTTVELVADRATGRLLGGSVTGELGVAGRVNVIAAALASGMRVEDFDQLDLAYAPPFAPVWDPLLVASHQLLKAL